MPVQIPFYLLLGSLAFLFPIHAGLIAMTLVSWVIWQRQR